jgi:hypothetical protein
MKVILIDPIRHSVGLLECSKGIDAMYALLTDKPNGLVCDCFTAIQLDRRNALYVDDNGLLKDPRYFFIWRGYQQPLAGRGLIMGVREDGESISTNLDPASVIKNVQFMELSVQGFEHYTGKTQLHGKEFAVIGNRPVFGPPRG